MIQTPAEQSPAAEHAASRRSMCTAFRFWSVCAGKACRRARACKGANPNACFDTWWPQMPEELKVMLRGYLTALKRGEPRREALAAAQADLARWQALQGEPRCESNPSPIPDPTRRSFRATGRDKWRSAR